jgi:hypothetical protein
MACLLTQGFTTDCLEGIGGVKEIFFQNWEDFNGGITFDGTTGEIDALPTATLYRYVPLKNSASFTETPTPSAENGTLFYAQSVTLRLGKLDATKRKELNLMVRAKLVCFVRLFSNQIVIVGRQSGCFLTGGVWQTGQANGDFSGYEIVVSADEVLPGEFTEAYTSQPFDNFAGITVSPAYSVVS